VARTRRLFVEELSWVGRHRCESAGLRTGRPVCASTVPALTTFRLLGPTAQPCGERLLRPGSARLGLSQKGGLPVARRSEKEDGGSRPSTRARGGQQPSCPSLGSRAGRWVGLHRRAF